MGHLKKQFCCREVTQYLYPRDQKSCKLLTFKRHKPCASISGTNIEFNISDYLRFFERDTLLIQTDFLFSGVRS